MKKLLIGLSAFVLSSSVFAQCTGTTTYSSCYDYNTGNNYTVTRMGNTTQVQGYNSRTGSSWSQNSQTYGNTTYQNGTNSNGGSWNQTINHGGFGTTYSGGSSNTNGGYSFRPQF